MEEETYVILVTYYLFIILYVCLLYAGRERRLSGQGTKLHLPASRVTKNGGNFVLCMRVCVSICVYVCVCVFVFPFLCVCVYVCVPSVYI